MNNKQCGIGGWLNALVAAALILRAVIPAGFMPSFAPSGELMPLVICSSDTGQSTVYLPASELPDAPQDTSHDNAHDNTPCAYAATFAHAAAVTAVEIAAYIYEPVFADAPETVLAAHSAAKPYHAQAPPVSFLQA